MIVNSPGALGGIGASTGMIPSLTLGCGAIGGSATSDNVGPMNLLNRRCVAEGLKELDEIKKEIPDCGSCRPMNMKDVDLDAVVEEIVKRLRSI